VFYLAETGDKFIIEIGDKFANENGETLYRIKGFKSLVFDENGIGKLTPHKKEKEFNIQVGDQFKLNNTDKTIVITRVDHGCKNVSLVWDDGNTGSATFDFLLKNYTKTGINYFYELDVLFGELPY